MDASRVLIQSVQDDSHADAVCWALRQLDIPCDLWFPDASPISAKVGAGLHDLPMFRSGGPRRQPESYRSVWFRRSPRAHIPSQLNEKDQEFLQQELLYYNRGIGALFGSADLLANPPASRAFSDLKLPQLLAAREAGFAIPETLSSNDLDDVRAFVADAPGKVIYKSHSPGVWRSKSDTAFVFTTAVTSSDFEDVDPDHFNPGLFQHYVKKQYELRVSIFGRNIIAVKIEADNEIDWRVNYKMKLAPIDLPEQVTDKLLLFMNKMNLVMGMIDIIVTPDGDYVFLEINPQGQFLWIEGMNPEIRLLQPFARFLASADPAHQGDRQEPQVVDFRKYRESEQCRTFLGLLRARSEECSSVDEIIHGPHG